MPEPGLVFRDAWTAPGCEDPGYTWADANPYAKVEHEQQRRIDYVFTGWRRNDGRGAPLSCRVVGDEPVDGVWPSDHYGVLASSRPSAVSDDVRAREALQDVAVVCQRLDVEVEDLGLVVPAAEGHGCLRRRVVARTRSLRAVVIGPPCLARLAVEPADSAAA